MGLCHEIFCLNLFRMISFPCHGGIIAINQHSFFATDSFVTRSIPLVVEFLQPYQHFGIRLLKYSSLLGTFTLPHSNIPNMVGSINMILSSTIQIDPYIVPDNSNTESLSNNIMLSPIDLKYEAIYLACLENIDTDILVNWFDHSRDSSSNPFNDTFSINEIIIDIVIPYESPYDDHHDRSSLQPYSTFLDSSPDKKNREVSY